MGAWPSLVQGMTLTIQPGLPQPEDQRGSVPQWLPLLAGKVSAGSTHPVVIFLCVRLVSDCLPASGLTYHSQAPHVTSQLKGLLWEGNLLSLDRSCYSMHSIHFKENSMVAPDLSLPGQEGSVQHRAGRMEKVRPLPGSPACYNCLWVACLLGCLNWCFNKCCCNARICDLVNTLCTSKF